MTQPCVSAMSFDVAAGESIQDWTFRSVVAMARLDEIAQSIPKAVKLGELLINLFQVRASKRLDVMARPVTVFIE